MLESGPYVEDALKPLTHKKLIEHELEGFGIRLNREPPKITFRKKDKARGYCE